MFIPTMRKFTPCQRPLCSFPSGRDSLPVSAFLKPALYPNPGPGTVRLHALVSLTSHLPPCPSLSTA